MLIKRLSQVSLVLYGTICCSVSQAMVKESYHFMEDFDDEAMASKWSVNDDVYSAAKDVQYSSVDVLKVAKQSFRLIVRHTYQNSRAKRRSFSSHVAIYKP